MGDNFISGFRQVVGWKDATTGENRAILKPSHTVQKPAIPSAWGMPATSQLIGELDSTALSRVIPIRKRFGHIVGVRALACFLPSKAR